MIKIYFDDVLIDEDTYSGLDNTHELFENSFKLGSTASEMIKLSIDKTQISTIPDNVRIEDDNTIYNLIVDSVEEDKRFYNYTLVSKLLLLNYNYDAKELIESKKENNEDCYLHDILEDMCTKVGLEIEPFTWINDIVVDWWDNRVQARKYTSFIAELQSGYACILSNGKLTIKPHRKAPVKTIDIDECSDFILGEHKIITRVVFDNGIVKYEFGNEEGTTIYLDTDNVYITEEQVVENIYNTIKDFEFYLLEAPQCPMDSSIKAGDIITFTDEVNSYNTIAQYNMAYFGGWAGGFELKVATNKQEETQITGDKESIKNIKTEIDRTNATLNILAEETTTNTSQIAQQQISVGNISQRVSETNESLQGTQQNLSETQQDVESIKQAVQIIGGTNLIQNSMYLYGNDKHIETNNGGFILAGKVQDLINLCKSSAMVKCVNYKTQHEPINTLADGDYTLTFRYSNEAGNRFKFVLINTEEVVLIDTTEEKNFEECIYQFKASGQVSYYLECEYVDNTAGGFYTDIIIADGLLRKNWEPANGEIIGTALSIYYNGVEITSPDSSIKTIISNLGFTVTDINDVTNIILTLSNLRVWLINTHINGYLEIMNLKIQQQDIDGDDCYFFI